MRSFLLALLLAVGFARADARSQYAGGDISLLPLYEELESQYYDYDGNKIDDLIQWYAKEGMNVMRVRLMVNPDLFAKNYPFKADANVCQTLDYILPICKRIKAAGMDLLLDFHYSDFWADPMKQFTPEEWRNLSEEDLQHQVYWHTRNSLEKLKENGVVPDLVQIGNEISFGMLWGGYCGTDKDDNSTVTNYRAEGENDRECWKRLSRLLNKGSEACRFVCPDAKIIIHTEQLKNHWNLWNFYRWITNEEETRVDYDIIGLSWYPYWHVPGDKTYEDVLKAELVDLQKYFPSKKIMLVEFNQPYGWEESGSQSGFYERYPHTYAGQVKSTQETIDILNQVDNAIGLIWWWPEFNKKDYKWWNKYSDADSEPWKEWYSSALFDSKTGRALPATKTLAAYAKDETVYFTNVPASWTTPGIYAWSDGDNNSETGWPGAALELTDMTYKGKPVYKYSTTGNAHKYMIVNNRHLASDGNWTSTDQTIDLNFKDGAIYWLSDWRKDDGGSWKYDVYQQEEGATLDAPCVYLTNVPSDWNNVSLTAWSHITGTDINEVDGGALEQLTDRTYNGKPVYKYTFTGSTHETLLFHNRPGGNWDDNYVAVSRPFVNGALYILSDGKNAENNTKYSAPYLLNPSFDGNFNTYSEAASEIYLFGYINGQSDWKNSDNPNGTRDRMIAGKCAGSTYTFHLDIERESWFRLRVGDTEYGPRDKTDRTLSAPQNEIYTAPFDTDNDNGVFKVAPGNYTVTVEYRGSDNGYMLSIAERQAPVQYPDMYLISDVKSWSVTADHGLRHDGNGVYRLWLQDGLPAGYYKISNPNVRDPYSLNSNILPNHTYYCSSNRCKGDDMHIDKDIPGPVTVVFDYINSTVHIEAPNYQAPQDNSRRLYIHFGQNIRYHAANPETTVPKVHLYATTQFRVPSDRVLLESNSFEMTRVVSDDPTYDLWYYDLTDDQLSWAKDATFFFENKEGNLETYTCGRLVDGDDFNWDFEHWLRYIYYVDVADNYNSKASQSYITWDELAPVRKADKTTLYMVGQGLKRLAIDASGISEWDRIISPDIYGSSESAMNIFYISNMQAHDEDLTISYIKDADGNVTKEVQGTKFKMSWLRPYTYNETSGKSGGDICQQRAWATFNLGIVGYSLTRATAANLEVVSGETTTNRDVHFAPSQTFPCNNFNQYDWFVPTTYIHDKYILVVDLDEECNTVTLLPFQPNPTATAGTVSIQTGEFASYDEATEIMYNSQLPTVSASTDNGTVKYRKYNVATAPVTIAAPHNDEIKGYEYTVEYAIYYNGNKTEVCTDNPGTVYLAGLPVKQDEKTYSVGVRAKYTDQKTTSKFTFHSKYAPTTLNVASQLGTPTVQQPDNDKKFYTVSDYSTPEEFSMGAYMDVPVYNNTSYAWYADFQATPYGWAEDNHRTRGGELMHESHPIISRMAYAKSRFNPLKDWSKHDNGSYFGDNHDWSGKLASNVNVNGWPVYLPEVNVFSRDNNDRNTIINMAVTAIYPFLVDENPVRTQAMQQGISAKNRSARLMEGHKYHLEFLSTTGSADIPLNNNGVISGLEAISPDAPDTTVRYFNLQGVEVNGVLTPGVYIRQQGTTAEKIIVR